MTKEEFRIKFSTDVAENDTELFEVRESRDPVTFMFQRDVELSFKGLDTLTNIAENAAEPLFEEIEKLRADKTYWFDKYGVEVHKTLDMEKEIQSLHTEISKLKGQLSFYEE
jgi:hypothetical protein